MKAEQIVSALLETDWHAGHRLEAGQAKRGFIFFKNKLPIAEIWELAPHHDTTLAGRSAYLSGMGVSTAAHGTGIGRAAMQFVLDTTDYDFIVLNSSADQFYKKLGFVKDASHPTKMVLDRRNFTGSSLKFTPIDAETAKAYSDNAKSKGQRLRAF